MYFLLKIGFVEIVKLLFKLVKYKEDKIIIYKLELKLRIIHLN